MSEKKHKIYIDPRIKKFDIKAYRKKYYAEHKEKQNAYCKAWYKRNRERILLQLKMRGLEDAQWSKMFGKKKTKGW